MPAKKKDTGKVPAYFRNDGGASVVALHGPVLPGEYLKTDNPVVARGLRGHSRFIEVKKKDYEKNAGTTKARVGAE